MPSTETGRAQHGLRRAAAERGIPGASPQKPSAPFPQATGQRLIPLIVHAVSSRPRRGAEPRFPKKKPPSLVGLGGSGNRVLRGAYGLYFTVAQP
jgi:hypothetical protein